MKKKILWPAAAALFLVLGIAAFCTKAFCESRSEGIESADITTGDMNQSLAYDRMRGVMYVGTHGGVLGETCAITILVGGCYLIATKVISPVIPVTYLASAAVLSVCFGLDPIVQLLSGGLMLGAFFMATDYVTSPTTDKGKLVFGIGLGLITMMIRKFGTMNEGVSFAILLMNLMVPYIDALTRQDKLGIAKKKEAAAK